MSELQRKFGKLLQLERERRKISLADLSSELKITEASLESIETGNISSLPSDLYYSLFAKSYAEYFGIDYTKTIEAIREDLGEDLEPSETDKESVSKAQSDDETDTDTHDKSEDQGDKAFLKRAITFAVIIIVAFLVFVGSYRIFFYTAADYPGETSGKPETGVSGDTESMAAQEYAGYNWPGSEYTEPDSLKLSLTAREESWATVVTDGDTSIYRNLQPWREYTASAKYRLLVSIGIPRVVSIQLNEQEVYLANPQSGRISRVEINQVNRDQFTERPINRQRQPVENPDQEPPVVLPPDETLSTNHDQDGD